MNINFYQSNTWKEITKYIFGKPVFEVEFLGKKYFGIIKEKEKMMVKLRWYQMIGIELGNGWEENTDQIKLEINKIKNEFKTGYSDILFQFGFINEIAKYGCQDLGFDDNEKLTYEKRLQKEIIIKNKLGLIPSFRENMPLATVIFDLSIGGEKLFQNMSKSARAHIKKANGRNLYFEFAQHNDWDNFYNIWYQTSSDKGFNIISKKTFNLLKEYLIDKKVGNLFLAKKDGEIISGSICIFIDNNIIYLYGATNRDHGNVGGHQFLKNEIFKRGCENGYKYADLLGVAPAGYPEHHLEGVSKFKQSLGGTKIEYLGNYDLVFNNNLYQTFKIIRNAKETISSSKQNVQKTISEKISQKKEIKEKIIDKKDNTTSKIIDQKEKVKQMINGLKEKSKSLEIQKNDFENKEQKNTSSNLHQEIENLKNKIDDINKSIEQKEIYLQDLETKYSKLEDKLNYHDTKKIFFKIQETGSKNFFDTKICVIGFGATYGKFVENIIKERFFESNGMDSNKITYIDTGTKDGKQVSIKSVLKNDIIIVGPNDHVIADMTLNSKNAIYDELIQIHKHKNVYMRTKNKKPYLTESCIKEMIFEGLRNL